MVTECLTTPHRSFDSCRTCKYYKECTLIKHDQIVYYNKYRVINVFPRYWYLETIDCVVNHYYQDGDD